MARPLNLRRPLRRAAAVGAAVLAPGVLCGFALVSEPGPSVVLPAQGPPAPALVRRPDPRRVEPVVQAAPAAPPAAAAPAAPPAAAAPVVAAPPEVEPELLVDALPDPRAMVQLAGLLAGPDPVVGAAVAEALARAPSSEARALLVSHLSRAIDDAPGLDHLACLEALSVLGRAEDLVAVLPWARRADAAGVLGAWCVRAICAREGLEPPEELPEPDGAPGPRSAGA